MEAYDPVSYDAFVRLLARPDPWDLPRRAHGHRYEGDPDRRATRLPGILMRWLQRRYLEKDIEEPLAAPLRALRSPARPADRGLRVLRPTGTG